MKAFFKIALFAFQALGPSAHAEGKAQTIVPEQIVIEGTLQTGRMAQDFQGHRPVSREANSKRQKAFALYADMMKKNSCLKSSLSFLTNLYRGHIQELKGHLKSRVPMAIDVAINPLVSQKKAGDLAQAEIKALTVAFSLRPLKEFLPIQVVQLKVDVPSGACLGTMAGIEDSLKLKHNFQQTVEKYGLAGEGPFESSDESKVADIPRQETTRAPAENEQNPAPSRRPSIVQPR